MEDEWPADDTAEDFHLTDEAEEEAAAKRQKERKKQRSCQCPHECIANVLLEGEELQGSYARDHLANERTFLAWSRTSLAAVGLGIAIAKLTEGPTTKESGMLFILVGVMLLIYAVSRYFLTFYQIKNHRFSPNTWGIALVIILSAGAAAASIILAFVE